MSEKKTFKNQRVAWQYEPLMRKYGWCVEGLPCFFADEWDMEVTFTKKEKSFRVNDQVIIKGGGELAVIWHIIDERAWVNVVAASSGAYRNSHHVVKLSELKHVS